MFIHSISVYDLVGFMGAFLYIANYALIQLGITHSTQFIFSFLNLIAAIMVLASLSYTFNMSAAFIQITYFSLSLFGITKFILLHSHAGVSDEDCSLARTMLPNSNKRDRILFLRQGQIHKVNASFNLATEGNPIDHLAFLVEGSANIYFRNEFIGTVEPGHFVNEMPYTAHSPAQATIVVNPGSVIYVADVAKLSRFMKKHPTIHVELERGISAGLRKKLASTQFDTHFSHNKMMSA